MLKLRLASLLLIYLYLLSSILIGNVLNVTTDYATIQEAINAAVNGDTVLVAPGMYVENINFNGKNIVVASHYLIEADPEHIVNTVIDGSQPAHPDTASCVRIVSGEDSTAILAGFTLTGGVGTIWRDTHLNQNYREGGGILIELAAPVIRHNLIINNQAIDKNGVISAGGGGIRVGDGNPKIIANVIMDNAGLYGGGIVMNFSTGLIQNNIICNNTGGDDYGGSGVWTYEAGETILDHNTIVNNVSKRQGGGVQVWDTSVRGRNNIIWGNKASLGDEQIYKAGSGMVDLTYNLVEGGWEGTGNISLDPLFLSSNFLLTSESPAVDAGEPESADDPADTNQPNVAAYPALGGLRADMGAYGGPLRIAFPFFFGPQIIVSDSILQFNPPEEGTEASAKLEIENRGNNVLVVDSMASRNPEFHISGRFPLKIQSNRGRSVLISWQPGTLNQMIIDTLLIFHDDPKKANPLPIILKANSTSGVDPEMGITLPERFKLYQNYPNPFNPETHICYVLPISAWVTVNLFNIHGQLIETLIDQEQTAGVHTVSWNGILNSAQCAANGIYFYELSARSDDKVFRKKNRMVLLK